MLQKIIPTMIAAALVVLILPAVASAYGAAHVGYTHVGPNGVYHAGRTVGYGPGGAYSGGHVGAYGSGGASYHAGYGYGTGSGGAYGGAYHYGTTGGASYGTYQYSPSYYGGAAAYGYVR